MIGTTPAPPNAWGKFASNVYSQFGEDGVIEEIFKRIGTTNKQCFEVGAADGKWLSNTRKLIGEGWKACLIEADESNWPELDKLDGENGTVVVHGKAESRGDNSLDSILAQCDFDRKPDLGVIDVDGQDYYLWLGMLRYRPRVMVVEYDPFAEPAFVPDSGGDGQAGLDAVSSVAVSKGYFNVGATQTNAIFVRNEERSKFYEFPDNFANTNGNRAHLAKAREASEQANQVANRVAELLPPEPAPILKTQVQQEIKIAALLSRPRYGTNTFWDCATEALSPWHIPIHSFYGVFWGQCMQKGMEEMIDQGLDWILTLDYDSLFTSEHLSKLIDAMGQNPEIDALAALQCRRGRPLPLLVREDGKAPMTGQPIPVTTAHFGLTLIRTEAIRRMPKPWFWSTPTPAGDWNEGRLDDDIYFWGKFRDSGNKLFVHTGVRIGHLEEMASEYSENYEQRHVYLTEWRKANGHKTKAFD